MPCVPFTTDLFTFEAIGDRKKPSNGRLIPLIGATHIRFGHVGGPAHTG